MSKSRTGASLNPTGEARPQPSAVADGETFTLSITDFQNPVAKGDMTISVVVKNNALQSLSANDKDGNRYEVSFLIRKKKTTTRGVIASPSGDEDTDPGDDGDENEDNGDECQRCELRDGRTVCMVIPCPL